MDTGMKIITGHTGTPHISSQQDADSNAALFGHGDYVLPVGSQLRHTIESNNRISIGDGQVMMQGRKGSIDYGRSEVVGIDYGSTGNIRHDIIAVRYEREMATQLESMGVVVVKGVNGQGDPSLEQGSIREGAVVHEMSLYRVRLVGINIESVEPMFTVWLPGGGLAVPLTISAVAWMPDGRVTIYDPHILAPNQMDVWPELSDGAPLAERLAYERALPWTDIQADGSVTLSVQELPGIALPIVLKMKGYAAMPHRGVVTGTQSGIEQGGGANAG